MRPPVTRIAVPESLDWIITKLGRPHDRGAFDCGVEEINSYLQRFASQNEKSGVSQHFVAVPKVGATRILGYYALSAGRLAFQVVPDDLRKRLPRYPVPVAHIGRLAVDVGMQGKGLGSDLLIDALTRIARVGDEIGIHAIEIVAINAATKRFYRKYGFSELKDDPCHLFLPMTAVRKLGIV